MRNYDSSLPVAPTPVFDTAFFAAAALTDVPVRDAQGQAVRNPDGSFVTAKGEIRDLLVPMAGDRAAAIAQSVNNQRVFVEQGNAWMGSLNRAAQEIERLKPTGNNSDKTPRINVPGQELNVSISAETANTLFNAKNSSNASLLSTYFVAVPQTPPASGFAGPVILVRMADKQAFAVFDNAFKSAIDSASQKVQLDQTTLQGLVSRQNNAIETMADLQKKFTATHDKLVGNLRPPK